MSQKKIIFLIIVGILSALLVFGLLFLGNKKPNTTQSADLTLWINEGTSEDFQKLITGFQSSAPEYKKINITVQKKPNDAEKYRTILLQTLADNAGPDIFMIQKGEDSTLENRIEPIPGEFFAIADFETRFDDIFSGLINRTDDKKETLLGVPVGYETLGIFYNTVLTRPSVPKTLLELESMYTQFITGKYPSNLGLSPQFVPNIADILPMFFLKNQIYDYGKVGKVITPLESYYSFGDLLIGGANSENDEIYSQNETLRRTEKAMAENKLTTIDEFMKGNIAMIIGYPSLITELEKSKKRAGSESIHENILTDKIPLHSLKTPENIAKYSYLAISKNSKNPEASLAFLKYLTTPDAGRILMEIYPYMIPAQKELQASAAKIALSSEIPRAKLDGFIPSPGTKLYVFDYGLKEKFLSILDKEWQNLSSQA